jgi:hypothetical protein
VVRTKWQRRSRTPQRRFWKEWQAQVCAASNDCVALRSMLLTHCMDCVHCIGFLAEMPRIQQSCMCVVTPLSISVTACSSGSCIEIATERADCGNKLVACVSLVRLVRPCRSICSWSLVLLLLQTLQCDACSYLKPRMLLLLLLLLLLLQASLA